MIIKRRSGFTLIELSVALMILALLVSISLPSFQYWLGKNRARTMMSAISSNARPLQLHYFENDSLEGLTVAPEGGAITSVFGNTGAVLPREETINYSLTTVEDPDDGEAIYIIINFSWLRNEGCLNLIRISDEGTDTFWFTDANDSFDINTDGVGEIMNGLSLTI